MSAMFDAGRWTWPWGGHREEANMSKFDAAIDAIRGWQRVIEAYAEKHPDEIANLEEAIHILTDYPRWQPLLETAGGVDKARAIRVLATLLQRYVMGMETITIPELENDLKAGAVKEIRALLASIPDKEE
jgi:hypothetical protein